eukprot:Nitzschia sp. Nitz4//scaffold111_size72815//47846//48643//NITZ4_005794-RA/size72815-snap-gene-0.108-mRNA-1//-1//CDS//3329533192//1604//frame0
MSSPSWLQASNDAPAPAAAAPAPATTHLSTTTPVATPEDDKDLPQVILMMRLTNMGMAVALITFSVLTLLGIPAISTFVLAIYAICGGLLICCLETQLKFLRVVIAVNFGFLFNSVWRFFFYMILASVCWCWDSLFGMIMAIAIVTVAFFNTYVLCRYPGYRRLREQIAEEEDKRIEARISKEVKKQAVGQAVGQMFGGK